MTRWPRRPICRALALLLAVSVSGAQLAAQGIDLDAVRAQEEFRWGVQAYHAARYADALVAFSRALAFVPENLMAVEWLGRTYERLGLVEAAVAQWREVADRGAAGAYLIDRIALTEARRVGFAALAPESFSLSDLIPGRQGETERFSRPTAVAADRDGGFWVVSLADETVVRFNANGRLTTRITGGLQGLDHPTDVLVQGDTIAVAEFGGDRVSVFDAAGRRVREMGTMGRQPGQLLGPQYLAPSGDGGLFVTEWGNRRVSRFSADGTFILAFGTEGPGTLQRPTGVATRDDRVFVVDNRADGPLLVVFDEFGNFDSTIPLPVSAEGAGVVGVVVEDVSWYDRSTIVVGGGTEPILYDIDSETVRARMTDGAREAIHAGARDANGRIVAADFAANELAIFEPDGRIYAGLDVRIDRVLVDAFPEVRIVATVRDRLGQPIVGLESENFVVTDRGVPRTTLDLILAGYRSTNVESTILVDAPTAGDAVRAAEAVEQLWPLVVASGGATAFLRADDPSRIGQQGTSASRVAEQIRAAAANGSAPGESAPATGGLDRNIRLAVADSLRQEPRRTLVLVTDGAIGEGDFDEFGLQETADYLAVHDVQVVLIMTQQRSPDAELRYLVEATGGQIVVWNEPEGFEPLVSAMQSRPSGRYVLRYTLPLETPPVAYAELALEARLFVRSGRDEAGYVPPDAPDS